MISIEKNRKVIPIDEIKGIDYMFSRQMKFDVKNVPEKFRKIFDQTRRDSYGTLTLEGIFESFEIDEVNEDHIKLRGGEILESTMLARAFNQSSELVFYVVSVSGYESLDEAEENMVAKLFLDGWGTAVVECGASCLKRKMAEELERKGIYSTFSFSPGQHNVSMELQKVIFRLLKPAEIGVTLNDHFLMHPKKSVSGIFGIGYNKGEEGLRPCDFCDLRETCSSAYAGDAIESNF